jgi:hypothetical protein
MRKTPSIKEARVNIPIGNKNQALVRQAKLLSLTKTRLARILLLDSLTKLEAGEIVINGPAVAAVKEGAA